MFKKILIVIILISMAYGQEKISLETAIEKGLQKSTEMMNRKLDEINIYHQQNLAEKAKRFSLKFGGAYSFRSQKMEMEIPAAGPFPGISKEIGSLNNYDLKFSVYQPIYTGGLLTYKLKMQQILGASQKSKTKVTQVEYSGQIKKSYFTIRVLKQKKQTITQLLDQLNLHKQKLEKLSNEDLIKPSDLLETKQKIEELKIQIDDINNEIHKERIHFKTLCDYDEKLIESNYSEKCFTENEALELFKNNHPILKEIEYNKELLKIQKKIIDAGYKPQVGGFTEVHYGKPGINYFKDEWAIYLQAGVNVSIPVFDWKMKKEKLAIQDNQLKKVENKKNGFVDEIEEKVKQCFSTKENLVNKLSHIEKMLDYANQDIKIKENLYREQQISHIDFLAVLTNKQKYENMQSEVKYQIQIINVLINTLIGKS